MSVWWVGALLGGAAGVGLLLIVDRVVFSRGPSLASRVLPYVPDLPRVSAAATRSTARARGGALGALVSPMAERAARRLGAVLGGAGSIRRKLERAGSSMTVQDFRVEQVLWACVGFTAAAAVSTVAALRGSANPVALLIMCAAAAALGVMARDYWLSSTVQRREQRILDEFPTVADLLALSVAAGEGPSAAIARVSRICRGELSVELTRVLAESRTGVSLPAALDDLSRRTGVPAVARFAEGFAVAIDRGTPLAEVLRAQAADVREATRRSLIEAGARKEVLMMIPVVFLVLPVTVLFAFWPGVIGLRLAAP
ncbi:MAG TPA: type II secretion system F family protein [Nocardioidaceae bacterium]|nr:type II secretion system F family protein [Nocardioidaceae bacterium]